jgi:hypothetical protein
MKVELVLDASGLKYSSVKFTPDTVQEVTVLTALEARTVTLGTPQYVKPGSQVTAVVVALESQ